MVYKTYKEIEGTWVCQFNKPENKAKLKMYKNDKDRSLKKLIEYYRWVISVLINTPAWGVSGVNKIVNELTDAVRATAAKAKTGKTSAYAQAGKLLNDVNYWKDLVCYSNKHERTCWLKPVISEEELQQLELLV